MLKSPAVFPFPGSYALHEVAGQFQLARIIELPGPGVALISYPLRSGASGNTQVDLGALIDGTPLSVAEKIEQVALERKMAGKARVKRADRDREEELRAREIHAEHMTKLIEQGMRLKLIDRDTGRQALARGGAGFEVIAA